MIDPTKPLIEASRPGENLQNALDEANRNAREFRQRATNAAADADKWEAIAAELLAVVNRSRTPAKIKSEVKRVAHVPYGHWWREIQVVLSEWGYPEICERGPTKKELLAKVMQRNPGAKEAPALAAIYHAISKDRLVYRVDHLYLPENAPPRLASRAAGSRP